MRKSLVLAVLLFAGLLPRLVNAEVKLPAIISSNMVIQAHKPVPIWGWAAKGEKVTVSLGDQKLETVADDAGKWKIVLKELKADSHAAPLQMTVEGTNKIEVKNIVVGTVWVCSGQSNMSFTLKQANNSATEIPKANYPKIRLFTVPRKTASEPQSDVAGRWVECTPETAPGFSAVAYFFGRDVHEATTLPTGLIHSSWGGTPAQAWTSLEGLKKDKALAEFATNSERMAKSYPAASERYAKESAEYPALRKTWEAEVGAEYLAALKAWSADAAKARSAHKPEPKKPALPEGKKPEPVAPVSPEPSPNHPSSLYNGMIAPLLPYAIEGVIWYQGESNAGNAAQYATLFPRLINDWREKWGEGDFAFYFVQLANFKARQPEPTDSDWARLREAQLKTLSQPNTGMAVIIDIGEGGNIHPTDKVDVGHRLALWALKDTFGERAVRSGPLYSGAKIDGNTIRVSFKEVGGGLVAKPLSAAATQKSGTAPLVGFAIAGEDEKFVWAKAEIDGDGVVVSSDKVANPKWVRYAWADNPECNLYNKEGLPASPFRTDSLKQAAAPARGR